MQTPKDILKFCPDPKAEGLCTLLFHCLGSNIYWQGERFLVAMMKLSKEKILLATPQSSGFGTIRINFEIRSTKNSLDWGNPFFKIHNKYIKHHDGKRIVVVGSFGDQFEVWHNY